MSALDLKVLYMSAIRFLSHALNESKFAIVLLFITRLAYVTSTSYQANKPVWIFFAVFFFSLSRSSVR